MYIYKRRKLRVFEPKSSNMYMHRENGKYLLLTKKNSAEKSIDRKVKID